MITNDKSDKMTYVYLDPPVQYYVWKQGNYYLA